MAACSLCSLMSYFFNCIYGFIVCSADYPILVFAFSLLIAFIFMMNIQSAKMICEFRSKKRGSIAGCGDTVAIAQCGPSFAADDVDYGYENGPHTWRCAEQNQSPINITSKSAQQLPIRELLTWNHYDDLPTAVTLENNGHTVIARFCYCGNRPTLCGADLLACYSFVQLCFRWSAISTDGSEHMINYRKYPLELQVMHRTGAQQAGCTSSYDILMLSYLYEISVFNPFLEPIVQNLYRVRQAYTRVEIPPFPLSYLCHQFRSGFFSYGGSLTEPPCYQGAEWFVFPETLAISERQLEQFRQIMGADGTRILRNARPVQNVEAQRIVNLNLYNPSCTNTTDSTICAEEQNDEEVCE